MSTLSVPKVTVAGFRSLLRVRGCQAALHVRWMAPVQSLSTTLDRGEVVQAGSWARKPPSLAVALNCGKGSSFLNALVKAFDRLHIVRGENSGYSGSKYRRWTSGSRLFGASSLPLTKCGVEDQLRGVIGCLSLSPGLHLAL